MKFDCGTTAETEWAKYYEKAKARAEYYKNWHPWFAWHPVTLGDHDCRWLEYVERRYPVARANLISIRGVEGNHWPHTTHYRAKEAK